jgi:hypothetical protein
MNSSPVNKRFNSGFKLNQSESKSLIHSSYVVQADGTGGLVCGAVDNWVKVNSRARARDKGGDSLQTARSLRPYLQGFAPPGTNRSLRDKTGRRDPDFYRLFDQASPNTFQADELLISCNLDNLSKAPISITLLDRQGNGIAGSSKTVMAGQSFVFDNSLSDGTYYIKVTSTAPGRHRYELNLPIINS